MASTAHALHILVKHKEQAEDILQKLKKGAKFQTLARKHSNCSGQLIPDSELSFSSATAGAFISL